MSTITDNDTTQEDTKQENTKQENTNNSISTIYFNKGYILHDIKVDKYTQEIKETFIFENPNTSEQFKIARIKMLDVVDLMKRKKIVDYKIVDGWEANSAKMNSGSGLGVRITLNGDYYEFIFLIGRPGEKFNSNHLIKKDFIKIEKNVWDNFLAYLNYCQQISDIKAGIVKEVKETTNFGNII